MVVVHDNSKWYFSSCTLLTRRSTSAFKMGMPYGGEAFKEKLASCVNSNNFSLKQLCTTIKTNVLLHQHVCMQS